MAKQNARAVASRISTVRNQRLLTQHETLDFSSRGLRQVVNKFDPARIFPRTDRAFYVNLEFFVECAATIIVAAVPKHNKCLRLDKTIAIFYRNDSRLEDLGMAD